MFANILDVEVFRPNSLSVFYLSGFYRMQWIQIHFEIKIAFYTRDIFCDFSSYDLNVHFFITFTIYLKYDFINIFAPYCVV